MDKMPKNDLGVDPEEWFDDHYLPELGDPPNPLDSMPIARYHDWEDTAPSEYEPPHEDDWFVDKKPEEPVTMHEKMYKIATARYNPFSLGGSENCDSDLDCNIQKHSPWPGGSENFQAKKEQEFTPENDPYGGY